MTDPLSRAAQLALFCTLLMPALVPVRAQGEASGLVTQASAHTLRQTLDRFALAVREAGWVVFTEIDHAAVAAALQMPLRPRVVIFFGNPGAGTPAMRAQPTLALDLPMRALVWEDDAGRVFVTRSSGEDIASRIFARHGIGQDAPAQAATEAFLARLTRRATE
ncbi:DUF302 domain-containing protein [Sediminicoccus sp. KRV36]|uniref:DUF302 domain-containing protein n=1 Tax=Sediminicoccus sp. KRV36 TaxID=3133721 RepID=UPI00200EAA9C|nr:DUF302 domain-containing protein [Sediminicoccus rosea]UPY35822.1 DUF302 domain-containing protein [Sediminicoccus rosea]